MWNACVQRINNSSNREYNDWIQRSKSEFVRLNVRACFVHLSFDWCIWLCMCVSVPVLSCFSFFSIYFTYSSCNLYIVAKLTLSAQMLPIHLDFTLLGSVSHFIFKLEIGLSIEHVIVRLLMFTFKDNIYSFACCEVSFSRFRSSTHARPYRTYTMSSFKWTKQHIPSN